MAWITIDGNDWYHSAEGDTLEGEENCESKVGVEEV